MVYLIVSPHNPFKDPSLYDSGEERIETAREIIERHGLTQKVKVDDIEFSMPVPSYTIRTLDALKTREPGNRFSLVIGGDNLSQMLEWKEGERILTEYGIVVYPRSGFNMVHDCAVLKQKHRNAEKIFGSAIHKPYHIKLLKDAPLVNISSSEIREITAKGENADDYLA